MEDVVEQVDETVEVAEIGEEADFSLFDPNVSFVGNLATRYNVPLELVYVDIWGPAPFVSHGGELYYNMSKPCSVSSVSSQNREDHKAHTPTADSTDHQVTPPSSQSTPSSEATHSAVVPNQVPISDIETILPIFDIPIAATSIPPTSNTHHMVTRSKSGFLKPKTSITITTKTIGYTIRIPKNAKQALQVPNGNKPWILNSKP
ncbi:hypothetical protein PIB30_009659 [Stylosanthes scabra]|uniref:Uncharacterized protein n=1 Tax=Stylosanthes scabra TaxID=79078 RepID=A0ABU6T5T0_9FABA|nr:hypothetical protein [Stylosanthes scabra]